MSWDSPRRAKYKGLIFEFSLKKKQGKKALKFFSERCLEVVVIKDASNYPERAKQDFALDNLQNQY